MRLLPDTISMKEIMIYTGQRSPVAWQHPPAQGTGRWTPRCWWQLERAAADPGCAGRQQRCPCTRPGRLQLLQPAHKIWWHWSPARPAEEHTETEACLHMTWRGKLPAEAGSNRHMCCSVLVVHGAIGLSLLLLARCCKASRHCTGILLLLQGCSHVGHGSPTSHGWLHQHR